jgi:hypothetical protein
MSNQLAYIKLNWQRLSNLAAISVNQHLHLRACPFDRTVESLETVAERKCKSDHYAQVND